MGFYQADNLVAVAMYQHWHETWSNWPRSLPMRDQYFGWREGADLAGALLLQSLPLPLFILAILFGAPLCFLALSGGLLALRFARAVGRRTRLSQKTVDVLALAALRSARGAAHPSVRPQPPPYLAQPNLRPAQGRDV